MILIVGRIHCFYQLTAQGKMAALFILIVIVLWIVLGQNNLVENKLITQNHV